MSAAVGVHRGWQKWAGATLRGGSLAARGPYGLKNVQVRGVGGGGKVRGG